MDRVGIEFITVFGLPPVEFVHLAADLGCRHISLGLAPLFDTPLDQPRWSLRDDPALRRDLASAMSDRGVSISLGEGFLILPEVDIRQRALDLDTLCELGVRRINAYSIDPDRSRSFDQLAALVEMAEGVGVETTLEFGPILGIPDLPTALAALDHVRRPGFRLLIDTLHLARAGLGPKDVAAIDPDRIGYAQLCDAVLPFTPESYMKEAQFERLPPGAGELPLLEVLAALPRDIVIGLEVPMLSQAQAGVGPHERVGHCVEAARSMLARCEG